ncbi:RNA polymerase subunit sigma-70 [marine bacterium AO1-C]|nr:RNA polymerase subunit sigma-70 [marine bacterium AO1-C]
MNPSETHISDLVKGCRKKDVKSQEALYKHFYAYALSICMRYTTNYDEAMEVMNDGFMRIFKKIKLYNSDYPFKSWLRRIMINVALNNQKKYLKHKQNQEIEQATDKHAVDDTYTQVQYKELVALVQKLSPGYRAVFNLYVIDGYTHEEIADILKISVGTSKSNLSKARANLRKLLSEHYEEDYARYAR